MTEMFGEAWSPMSVPDLAPDDDDVHSWLQGWYAQRSRTESRNVIECAIAKILNS